MHKVYIVSMFDILCFRVKYLLNVLYCMAVVIHNTEEHYIVCECHMHMKWFVLFEGFAYLIVQNIII